MSDPRGPAWRAPVALVRDPGLAALLGAMDFPEDPRGGFEHVAGDAQGCRFSFETRSRCGTYTLPEIQAAWEGGAEWIAANPDHPAAWMMAAFKWREHIHRLMTREPAYYLRKGAAHVLIDPLAPQNIQDRLCKLAKI